MLHIDLSIKTKVLLLFSLLLFAIGGVLAYLTIDSVRNDWAESEMLEKYGLAETEAENISRWIEGEARAISHVADTVEFDLKGAGRADEELKMVSELLSRGGSEPAILVMSKKGEVIYRDNATDWDQVSMGEVRKTNRSLVTNKNPDAEMPPFYVSPRSTRFLFVVPKRTTEGKLVGTLNVLLTYSNAVFQIGSRLSGPTIEWYILSSDSLNFYKPHSGDQRALLGGWSQRPRELLSKDGGYFISSGGVTCSYALIPHTDSYVTILDPVPGFGTALRKLVRLKIGFAVIALFLIVSLSFFVSNSLVRPIKALKKGVESLRNDTFSEVTAKASGEIGDLLDTFNDMGRLLQKNRKELRSLSDFASSLITDVQEEDVYIKVAKAVAEAFEAAVILSIEEKGVLIPKGTVGIAEDLIDHLRIKVGEGLMGTIFKEGKGAIVNDLSSDRRVKYTRIVEEQQFNKFAGVPLSVQDRNIGVLAILNPMDNRDFNKSDLYLLTTFAGQAAIRIRNHDLFEELETDMERIQQLQSGLIQSEKLAAVGQMVSGVAHELNNPLGVVLGYAQLASERTDDEILSQHLKKIEDAAERAATIVRNLLAFSRKREVSQQTINLNDVIRSVCDLVHPQLVSNDITLRLNLSEQLPSTTGDFQQLQQVFLNLVTNSIHAMEENTRGRLVISTFHEGPNLVATVSDDGNGISPENLSKVFEPFFTTKPVGKGTGLGLSLCYGIIKQHGGDITVQSPNDRGTVFTVELPIREASGPGQHLSLPDVFHGVSDCRILVVEDEPAMQTLLKDLLERYGCKVSTANNGKEALEVLQNTQTDMIISDLKMPEMDGEEFYRICISERPEYKDRFIFSSGDTASRQTHEFLENTHCEVLLKPFSSAQLLAAINRIRERLASNNAADSRDEYISRL